MIQSVRWIAKTSTTSFPLGIISIGPLLGEIWMANDKTPTKRLPRSERVKNSSRIFNIPANGSHRADHHWRHWLARYFTHAVFPFVMAGTKKRVFGFPPKKPKMPAGRWCPRGSSSSIWRERWMRTQLFPLPHHFDHFLSSFDDIEIRTEQLKKLGNISTT